MAEALIRMSGNPILYGAKDFTCSIIVTTLEYIRWLVFPVILITIDSPLWAVVKAVKGDIHPEDCFINNAPYYGNAHVGDT